MFRHFLFHNFGFVFKLDQGIKRRFTKAGLLVLGGLIAAAVLGIDTKQTLAYQLFSFLFTLLLLAFLSSYIFRIHLIARRHLPRFATVGETLRYRISIYNTTLRVQSNLTLLENIQPHPPSFETFLRTREPGYEKRNRFDKYIGYPRWLWLMRLGLGAEVAAQTLPPLPATSPRGLTPGYASLTQPWLEVEMTLTPVCRGYVHFTGMTFARPDPFGLFNALYTLYVTDSLIVLPKRYPIGQIPLSGARRYQRGGVHFALSLGDAQEYVSLREYRPGDSLRHMHWKSFAKTSKPIVKEFQDEFFVRHALILDTFIEQENSPIFEAAVSVAASLVCAQQDHEALFDLMFVGPQTYCFQGGRGLAHTDTFLEILAVVKACTDKPFDTLHTLILSHLHAISSCLCIFLTWDAPRQQLAHQLRQVGIPIHVFIISDKVVPIESSFNNTYVLHPDKLGSQLVELFP